MADNLLSYLVGNDISYKQETDDLISFDITHEGEYKKIFYSNKKDYFYLKKKDNINDIPHIMKYHNYTKGDDSFQAVCLTMDGTFREHTFKMIDQIKRLHEIIFELWDDKIWERFKELEGSIQPQYNKNFFCLEEGEFSYVSNDAKTSVATIAFQYHGEARLQIIEKLNHHPSEDIAVKFQYLDKQKTFIYRKSHNAFYRFDDYTERAFFERSNNKEMQEIYDQIIIVGAGSVGGVVLDQLLRNGHKNITIYDDDRIESCNTTRHILGKKINATVHNKASSLVEHYSKLYPNSNCKAIEKKFDIKKYNGTKNTIIFNTTGGADSERIYNTNILSKESKNKGIVTFVDIFIEAFGSAMHALLFHFKGNENISTKVDWKTKQITNPKKDFRNTFQGCFVSTLPYGFAPIQIAVPLLLKKIMNKNTKSCHLTVPMINFSSISKKDLNKDIGINFNHNFIGVYQWK